MTPVTKTTPRPRRRALAARLLCLACIACLAAGAARAAPREAALLDPLTPLRPSERVLGLYDSTDPGRRGERLLRERVQPALRRLGLTLLLHDVSAGLPREAQGADLRGVVTAFSDGKLRGALAYCRWLAAQAQRGRRLLLLEDFGAYQDAQTGRFTEPEELNRVFSALGLLYDAQWTDDPARLRLAAEDPALLRPGRHIDPQRARHYYRFRPLTPESVRAHVVIERADLADGRSVVVGSSAGGAMALSRYYADEAGEEYLDLGRLLELALFAAPAAPQRLLVIYGPRAEPLLKNLRWALRYGRLQGDALSLADLPRLRAADLQRYGAVALAAAGELPEGEAPALAALDRFVRDGGGLVALGPARHGALDPIFGVRGQGGPPVRVRALRFLRDLYPGTAGLEIREEGFFTDLAPLRLAEDAELVAAADPGGAPPLLFRRRHGAGRALYYNDEALSDKAWRGALLQLLLSSLPVAAAPVLGSLVYFVDDCPMPMWGARRDPVQRELGLSDTAFYRDVFFPYILGLARDFSLKLTFAAIFSYDDKTRGGFSAAPFYQGSGEGAPLQLARQAQQLGHEIALHGYNHQSLVDRPAYTSKGWPGARAMTEALLVARAEWQRVFGPGRVPFTYVAPNNHVGPLGKQALRAAFPEIRVLSALYLEDGPSKGQEYGDDPEVPELLALPRTTSELFLTSQGRAAALDSLMLVGAFSHFVHPDDIYDPERNGGLPWAELARRGREMLGWVRGTYPWLRPMTAREAHGALLRFRGGSFGYEVAGREVRVHLDAGDPTTFLLRTDPGLRPEPRQGATLLHSYPQLGYHYLSGTGPLAIIALSAAAPERAPRR